MKPLQHIKVIALADAIEGALARFLASLGAKLKGVDPTSMREHLPSADVLIDQCGLEGLADVGIARDEIERANPRLIHVSVTPFGSGGPRSRWKGSELIASAAGGTLRLTGDPDRRPVKEALDACGFHADMVAASGVMAALYERESSGHGQHIDVAVQEVAFSRNVNGALAWHFDRRKLHRVGGSLNYGRATVRCIWPLADGYCFHTLMTGRFGAPANSALSDWMDEKGVPNPLHGTNWNTYNRSTLDPQIRARWEAAIEGFFRTCTRHEIRIEGQRRGINATVLADPAEVLADPHLQAREFWNQNGSVRTPSRFVKLSTGPEVSAQADAKRTSARCGPLSGIRVLDFSWALVGSITTKTLGDLGAEIIKVESRTRPCLSRLDVQVSRSTAQSLDDKPWFAHLNTSKRSLALDMKKRESREILDPLLAWADVVVENFSPGTMRKLGLDYATLSERYPSLIMVSGSVYGQTGPLAEAWGVDGTGAALSGRTLLTGWPDRGPVIPGAVPYGDVIVPYVMAAAASAALVYRNRTGAGCHIDASMYEICVQQMRDALVAAQQGNEPQRMGNRDPRVFHQEVYPAQGEDRWIAVTCHTSTQWSQLCEIAGIATMQPDAAADALASWTSRFSERELVERLQSAGIAAAVVQDIEDLMERDPQLASRGALVPLEHAVLGTFGHMRTPITFSRSAIEPFRAPSLGEHSREIATTLCELSAERIEALEALGVFQ
ncbi:MAG TPA: CoA transferase [Steroidobacteraceae bacterium]|nr:CoA transferase [Steroidobacteraceae bacterium]